MKIDADSLLQVTAMEKKTGAPSTPGQCAVLPQCVSPARGLSLPAGAAWCSNACAGKRELLRMQVTREGILSAQEMEARLAQQQPVPPVTPPVRPPPDYNSKGRGTRDAAVGALQRQIAVMEDALRANQVHQDRLAFHAGLPDGLLLGIV